MFKSFFRNAWSRRTRRTSAENVERLNEAALELWHKGDFYAAETKFRQIIKIFPNYGAAYGNLGMVLADQSRFDEGATVLLAGLRQEPEHAGLHTNIGLLYLRARRIEKAIGHLRKALTINPDLAEASQIFAGALADSCQWHELDRLVARVRDQMHDPNAHSIVSLVTPFTSLILPLTANFQKRIAETYAATIKNKVRTLCSAARASPSVDKKKIRIGYFSCDFRDHPICHLASGLFERHNRERFEVFAYSYGLNDNSEYRKKIELGVDHFRDVEKWATQAISDVIAADDIAILVDLTGYSSDARPEVLALRPAPIQVNFLGYPGTMGADFIDYIIADEHVLPTEMHIDVSEEVTYLPGCFLPNLRHECGSFPKISRADAELPEDSVVFCCFAQPSRINFEVFARWMQILGRVPQSVLWLRHHNLDATRNLKRYAKESGISSDRLFFAGKTRTKEAHFSRLAIADICLDTLAYNGHTTTSDALWAGVPVLTCPGRTFASRVAASVLHDHDLDELICDSPEDYTERAVFYATHANELEAVRAKVKLGNTKRNNAERLYYVQNIEAAFERMWSRYCSNSGASTAATYNSESSPITQRH